MFKNLAGISLLVLAVGMISCSREIDRGVGTLQSVEVYDYKPHFACKDLGRENAVNWIEGVLGSSERGGSPDFFAISQLEKQRIELPGNFDSLGAFCDHALRDAQVLERRRGCAGTSAHESHVCRTQSVCCVAGR